MRRAAVFALAFALGPWASPAAAQVSAQVESRVLAEATNLQQSGRTPEALRALEEFLGAQPTSTSALIMLSQLGASIGEPARVLPYAERAVRAAGPGQTAAYQVWIRALLASDRLHDARRGARAWIESDPASPAAYSELAAIERTAGRDDDAVAVLISGRERVGSDDLFAQELARLYVARSDFEAAALEWVTILGWGDAGIDIVQRTLEGLDSAVTAAIAALDAALDADAGFQPRRASVYLGNRLGRPDWSLLRAERLVEGLDPDRRVPFLRQYALDSKNRGYLENAAWAATALADEADSAGERLQWRAMAAELARESGDEAGSRRSFEAIRGEAVPGTEAHRISVRRLFTLELASDPDAAEALLGEYAIQYPDEQRDLAAMSVELSGNAVEAGDLDRAIRVLGYAPDSPADASIAASIEGQRGRLALMSGDPDGALSHLEIAAFIPSGNPATRTDAIALVDALSRADAAESVALGRLILDVREGRGEEGAVRFRSGLRAAPASDGRPAILAVAALELSRAGLPEASFEFREGIVDAYPESPEAPAALLAMARSTSGADPERATEWLEQLILDYPESAVAPLARRLLNELDGAVPRS